MAVEVLTTQEAALPTGVLLRMAMLTGEGEELTAADLKQSTEQLLRRTFVKVDGQICIATPSTGGGGEPGTYDPPIPQSDVTGLVAALNRANQFTVIANRGSITMIDPGQNAMKWNNNTASAVTRIAISNVDANGNDKTSSLFGRFRGILQIRDVTGLDTCEYEVTDGTNGAFTQWHVTHIAGSLPAASAVCAIRFFPIYPAGLPSFGGNILSIAVVGDNLEVNDGTNTYQIPLIIAE